MFNKGKGKYYDIILNIIGCNKYGAGGVNYIYKCQMKEIFNTIPRYFEDTHIVDKEEFKFSMRWVLSDTFGGGCEVEEPENLFEEI